MVDDRAELPTYPEKTCSGCCIVLVRRPKERLNDYLRRSTCGTTTCINAAKCKGFNDGIDWYRESTGLPDWVDFGKYDVVDTDQGIFSPKSRNSTFVRTRSSIAEF